MFDAEPRWLMNLLELLALSLCGRTLPSIDHIPPTGQQRAVRLCLCTSGGNTVRTATVPTFPCLSSCNICHHPCRSCQAWCPTLVLRFLQNHAHRSDTKQTIQPWSNTMRPTIALAVLFQVCPKLDYAITPRSLFGTIVASVPDTTNAECQWQPSGSILTIAFNFDLGYGNKLNSSLIQQCMIQHMYDTTYAWYNICATQQCYDRYVWSNICTKQDMFNTTYVWHNVCMTQHVGMVQYMYDTTKETFWALGGRMQ